MSTQKTEQDAFPEIGELVIGKIIKVTQTGAQVLIDEYSNWKCFIHISDITVGYIRHIRRYLKEKQKKVLIIKRINKDRREIDLSLKLVSKEQQKQKLNEQKNREKARGLLENIYKKGKFTKDEKDKLEKKLLSNFYSLYDAFSEIIEGDVSTLNKIDLSQKEKKGIIQITSQIIKPRVEIVGNLELHTVKPNGIEIIKSVLLDVINNYKNNVDIVYVSAPFYELKITSSDFKNAEKILKNVLDYIKKNNKKIDRFEFTRKRSKKFQGF